MTYPIPHFSYSSLLLWTTCKWCWKKKYIDRIPSVSSEQAENGKEYHEQVHNYHTDLEYDKKLIKPYTDKYPVDYRRYSEVKFLLPVKNRKYKTPIPAMGFIDGITADGLCDLKLSSSKPKPSIQSMLYSAIYRQTKGGIPKFVFNWVNTKNWAVKNVVVIHNDQEIDELFNDIIKPFFKDIAHPDKMIMDGSPYGFHSYPDCPFC